MRRLAMLLALLPVALGGAQEEQGLRVHELGFLVEPGITDSSPTVQDLLGDLPSHVRSAVKDSPLDGAPSADTTSAGTGGLPPFQSPPVQTVTTADPLIFFHSDRPRTVDVRVHFPEGRPLAWFPRPRAYLSQELVWEEVLISPRLPRGRNLKRLWEEGGKVTWEGLLRARKLREPCYLEVGTQVERYLFYEAAVSYPLTLLVRVEEERVILENLREFPVQDLYVLPGRGDGDRRVAYLDQLAPGQEVTLDADLETGPVSWLVAGDLPRHLLENLERACLTQEEARLGARMVLEAPFMRSSRSRALYRLPPEEYARHHQLTVEPAPDQLLRVGLVLVPDLRQRTVADMCEVLATGTTAERRIALAMLKAAGPAGRAGLEQELPRHGGNHRARLERALEELERSP